MMRAVELFYIEMKNLYCRQAKSRIGGIVVSYLKLRMIIQ
jgi:hypothetical protein